MYIKMEAKPKLSDRTLVAGCGIGHKYVNVKMFFPEMVSVILDRSYHDDVRSSVHFSAKFGCNS